MNSFRRIMDLLAHNFFLPTFVPYDQNTLNLFRIFLMRNYDLDLETDKNTFIITTILIIYNELFGSNLPLIFI